MLTIKKRFQTRKLILYSGGIFIGSFGAILALLIQVSPLHENFTSLRGTTNNSPETTKTQPTTAVSGSEDTETSSWESNLGTSLSTPGGQSSSVPSSSGTTRAPATTAPTPQPQTPATPSQPAPTQPTTPETTPATPEVPAPTEPTPETPAPTDPTAPTEPSVDAGVITVPLPELPVVNSLSVSVSAS